MRKIRIKLENISVEGILNDTKTADAIWNALPIEGSVNLWGDEIYFSVPVKLSSEFEKEVVELGDLGYWPPGAAFCIFFGKTPASKKDEIRPASPVNIFGKIISDLDSFKKAKSGEKIIVEKSVDD